ncbi:MAG: cation diffusion facilitator family transporter [Dehalococcoidales bacterium]|nr:cation diffusion facilitator family transporter [Dehalococcoidales bacterium]
MQHNHSFSAVRKPMLITLFLLITVMIAEVFGGILSNSLALLGDAGHMFIDALALGLSLFAINIARRPATDTKTYGYHRVEILVALTNGTILVLIAIYIFYEAYQRFLEPPVIKTPLMLIVATIGLAANLIGMLLLKKASQGNLNVKAAFWHILSDTISSMGVIIGGVIMLATGWYIIDPIISIIIGSIILWGAFRILRESADILLESVPKHIQISKVIDTVKSVAGVQDIHDIHIWTITSGIYALSAHLSIEEQTVSQSTKIVAAVNQNLARNFSITHTTLQLECETCPNGLICNLN